MHDVDLLADPLAVVVALGLAAWVGFTVWRAQRDLRRERLTSMRDHRRRVEALRKASGPRALP